MTFRLVLSAYLCLSGVLSAADLPWLASVLCLLALYATGELLLRALAGVPAEAGVPAARIGLAAVAGLVTLPLIALGLHAIGVGVRSGPLVLGVALVATGAGLGSMLRDRFGGAAASRAGRIPAGAGRGAVGPDDVGPGGADPGAPASGGTGFGGPGSGEPGSGRSAGVPVQRGPGPAPSPGRAPAARDGAEISGERSPTDSAGSRSGERVPTDSADSRSERGAAAGPARPAGAPRGRPRLAGYARTGAAVAVPTVLAFAVGGVAVRGYTQAPRPAEPGYLSLSLNGWAAGIDGPVVVPVRGLTVPVRLASAGLDTVETSLRLRIDDRLVTTRPVTLVADTVHSLTVHVPALPADGCLRAVRISLGVASTGFYARGLRTLRTATAPRAAAPVVATGPAGPAGPRRAGSASAAVGSPEVVGGLEGAGVPKGVGGPAVMGGPAVVGGPGGVGGPEGVSSRPGVAGRTGAVAPTARADVRGRTAC